MAQGMAIGYGKTDFLGYGKKKLGYGNRHTPEAEMTPLIVPIQGSFSLTSSNIPESNIPLVQLYSDLMG